MKAARWRKCLATWKTTYVVLHDPVKASSHWPLTIVDTWDLLVANFQYRGNESNKTISLSSQCTKLDKVYLIKSRYQPRSFASSRQEMALESGQQPDGIRRAECHDECRCSGSVQYATGPHTFNNKSELVALVWPELCGSWHVCVVNLLRKEVFLSETDLCDKCFHYCVRWLLPWFALCLTCVLTCCFWIILRSSLKFLA